MGQVIRLAAAALLALAAAPVAPAAAEAVPANARYVAMGSSYAAGPGVGDPVPGGPERCGRSSQSYPRVLARRLGLDLIDASCSGAVTGDLLAPANGLPAQADAVDAGTWLVTVTVGGNDVRFVGNLYAGACAVARSVRTPAQKCPAVTPPTEAEWQALSANLTAVARKVHARAPQATLVFVDYPAVVPPAGTCVTLGVSETDAALARKVARRLTAVTAKVARANHARFLAASALTRGHDACAAQPWSQGATRKPGGVPMHPAIPAHAAIADRLAAMLDKGA